MRRRLLELLDLSQCRLRIFEFLVLATGTAQEHRLAFHQNFAIRFDHFIQRESVPVVRRRGPMRDQPGQAHLGRPFWKARPRGDENR